MSVWHDATLRQHACFTSCPVFIIPQTSAFLTVLYCQIRPVSFSRTNRRYWWSLSPLFFSFIYCLIWNVVSYFLLQVLWRLFFFILGIKKNFKLVDSSSCVESWEKELEYGIVNCVPSIFTTIYLNKSKYIRLIANSKFPYIHRNQPQ